MSTHRVGALATSRNYYSGPSEGSRDVGVDLCLTDVGHGLVPW